MTDARIPVKIGLKGHFGSMLAAMGTRTPPARLECTSAQVLHYLNSSGPERTVHDNNPFPPWIGFSVFYLD
jgi:hypothetical protein